MTNRFRSLSGIGFFFVGLLASLAAQVASRSPSEAAREIQALLKRNEISAAQKRVDEASRQFPKDAALYDLLGVVEAEEGNYVRAEWGFLKAIELDPTLAGAYLNLGRLYQQHEAADKSFFQKALKVYEKLLRIDPGNVEAHYQSAVLLERGKSFQASLDHLSRIPTVEQTRAQFLSVRCADLAGVGDRAGAVQAAQELLNSSDLTRADVVSILPVIEATREIGLEEQLLEGAVERHLDGFDVLETLGRLYERQGKWAAARATLDEAAGARPGSVDTLLELARVTDKEDDHKGALGYLAHARDLDPKNAAVHFFFGIVAVEENLLQEGYRSMTRAVELAPDNPYYNYALGIVARERADPREALPYFEKYCALRPRDPRGKLQLGITHFYGHEETLAAEELKAAARHRETAAAAHFFLGRIANQEGRFSEAFDELQQALAADPDYADPYAEEGIIYMKQKDYARAESALRHALAIDPDHYAGNLNLAIVYQRTGDRRAGEQTKRFEAVKQNRAENAKLALRSIEILR